MAKDSQDKKAHHVVPVTYLKRFTDDNGMVFGYRKDAPEKPLHLPPNGLGFINRYYSQPVPGGGWDHNTLEDFFGREVEGNWTPIVERIQNQEALDMARLEQLFTFIAALHVRVPAARDAVELALAKMVTETIHLSKDFGAFREPPPSLKGKLNQIQASIDPHKSIHAMKDLLNMLAEVNNLVGLRILRNETDVPLITSDNPVIFFDPSVSQNRLRPYFVNESGPIEMFVPIDPWNVIHAHTDFKQSFSKYGLSYEATSDRRLINRINYLTTRFAYNFVFAHSQDHETLIKRNAENSPVFDDKPIFEVKGNLLVTRMIFGPRRRKVKWDRKENN